MSRFFRGGDDSSSDSSSDEEELYSDEEEAGEKQKQDDSDKDSDEDASDDEDSDDDSSDDSVGGPQGASRFLKGGLSSDSENSDDEVRAKVRSAKDKRLDELDTSIKQIENGQKNGDWTLISAGKAFDCEEKLRISQVLTFYRIRQALPSGGSTSRIGKDTEILCQNSSGA